MMSVLFDNVQCNECKRHYITFKDKVQFSINEDSLRSIPDHGMIVRSFFERAEDMIINPILVGFEKQDYSLELKLRFEESFVVCPFCDKVYLKNQRDKDHEQRVSELCKTLRLFV